MRKYFDPMVSYFFELTDLMTSENFRISDHKGDSCEDLINFWLTIANKKEVLEFLIYEINILNIFAEFSTSLIKFKFLWYKIEEFVQDKERMREILLIKDLKGKN